MTKSCYFCVHCCDSKLECLNHSMSHFIPNSEWLEYIKLLDDQIAFREKAVNDLYERDCKIKELQKENEELKKDLECMKLTVGTLSERPY